MTFRVAPCSDEGSIAVAMDNPWGWNAGITQVPGDGDGKTNTNISVQLGTETGVHAVWLRFNKKGKNGYKADWFKFD